MAKIQTFLGVVVAYLLARTWLAFRDPEKLEWEVVFPPIDVAVISMLIWLGNRDPLSNVSLLYFFPLAQAAGTLNLRWSVAVALMVVVGAALATHGLKSEEPFNAFFRYFFILVMGSLITLLARAAASLREELGVAKDRNRIALEMHDGVQGHLVTIARQLELVEHIAEPNPARAKLIAAEARESTRLAADELRYLVQRMRAPSLAEGFIPALRQFTHNQATRNEIEYAFSVTGEAKELSREGEHALFRIAQEALNNILRHANATRIEVNLAFGEGVTLQVCDNGTGFEPDLDSPGLLGMQRRAEAVGGHLTIHSDSNGTKVEIVLQTPYFSSVQEME